MATDRREAIAVSSYNKLAGTLMRQARIVAGGGRPMKQEAFARQLAQALGVKSLARQTLSAWERGTAAVPAAALLASAERLGVEIDELMEQARETVRSRIAALQDQLIEAPALEPGSGGAEGGGGPAPAGGTSGRTAATR